MQKAIRYLLLTGWILTFPNEVPGQVALSREAEQYIQTSITKQIGTNYSGEIHVIVLPIEIECRETFALSESHDRFQSRVIFILNTTSIRSGIPKWVRRNSIFIKSSKLLDLGLYSLKSLSFEFYLQND